MSQPATLPIFLLDSSVIVKWYHEEQDTPIALGLRKDYTQGACEIRLADVSFYEFANTLHYLKKYTPEQIVERVQSLAAMDLKTYGFDLLALRAALDLCAKKNIAIYDAYLVALAQREDLVFVTADEKLLRKLGRGAAVLTLRAFSKFTDQEND